MQINVLLAVALAMVATVGFAVLFNAPRRLLWVCAVTGGTALLARELALQAGASPNLATFSGGLVIGLLAEAGARRFYVPALVFSVPGFIPLVPGARSYRTVLSILEGRFTDGLIEGVSTALLAGAIAAGIATTTAVFRLRRRLH